MYPSFLRNYLIKRNHSTLRLITTQNKRRHFRQDVKFTTFAEEVIQTSLYTHTKRRKEICAPYSIRHPLNNNLIDRALYYIEKKFILLKGILGVPTSPIVIVEMKEKVNRYVTEYITRKIYSSKFMAFFGHKNKKEF